MKIKIKKYNNYLIINNKLFNKYKTYNISQPIQTKNHNKLSKIIYNLLLKKSMNKIN